MVSIFGFTLDAMSLKGYSMNSTLEVKLFERSLLSATNREQIEFAIDRFYKAGCHVVSQNLGVLDKKKLERQIEASFVSFNPQFSPRVHGIRAAVMRVLGYEDIDIERWCAPDENPRVK